jgi:prophage regulatory protein
MMAAAVLKLPAVQAKTQLSRSSIYRLESEGKFPQRIQLGAGHSVGWLENEIDEWLTSRPRVADIPKQGVKP